MPRVIVLDKLAPEGLKLLEDAAGIQYEVHTGLAGDALREALAGFDGAICRSGVKITAESLSGNKRLRAIVRAGVGTDNIDKSAATRGGIVVMNTPAGNTLSTAEHTLAMILALSRNIPAAHQSLVEHRWDRGKYMGTQLAGKTLGIVGLGRIGQEVAKRAKAFDMRIVGFDPFLSKERAAELGVERFESVPDMLPQCHYLSVHTPLTDETRNLIGPQQVAMLPKGARLVNCARGGIYDETALAEGLRSGHLGGVALDVFPEEPCTDNPLFDMPGVVCTPHLGASTEEAQTQVAVEAVELLVSYLTTGAIRHAVNMSPLDPKTLAAMRGYLDVAYRLGRLLTQMDRAAALRCSMHYRGDVAEKDTRLLTAAFAAGLLEGALDQDVNIVNAELLLKERGIEIVEQSSTGKGAFSSVIDAELVTEENTFRAAGTLLGTNMPRLVQLGEHRLESYLDGILLVFQHQDVPGIIGQIGTVMGQHQVNIAQMAVGRASNHPGGGAVGVLNLDNEPPQAALDAILQHPAIRQAIVIKLPGRGELPPWLAE